jgi:cyanate permease
MKASMKSGRWMVLVAFMSVNVGIGLCYGTFGTLVLHLERAFRVDRASVSLALSLVALAHGLLGPVIARLIRLYSIRAVMVTGAVMAALGFLLLTVSSGIWALLAIYGLLIGPGTALMGTVPALSLVSNWYSRGQGRMMGLVMMPVMVTVAPLTIVVLLPVLGFHGVLVATAAAYLLSAPLLLTAVDRPEQIGQQPVGGGFPAPVTAGAMAEDAPVLSARTLWTSGAFLAMALGAGIIAGAGVAKSAHLVPILVEQGWDMQRSALLLSISGATGIAGSLLFGALADRFGAAATLAVNGLVQAIVWWILVIPSPFLLLIVDAALIGACGGGMMSAKAVLATRLFGRENFPAVAGLSALTTVPFLFAIAPATGLLRQTTGSYVMPLLAIIGLFMVAALLFGSLVRLEARKRAAAVAG